MEDLEKLMKPSRHHDISLGDGTDSRCFEPESWNYVQPEEFQVHVRQKMKEPREGRPIIPTTNAERLAFLRGYATSPFKLQIMYLQQISYSVFYWLYVWNLVFRSIPTNYIHVFLSTYSPKHHLYGEKMLPLCVGASWQVVLCGLLQLVSSADILSMFLVYGFGWLVGSDTWWSCPKKYYILGPQIKPYRCYTLKDFRNITHTYIHGTNRSNIVLKNNYYRWVSSIDVGKNARIFTAAPLHHFMQTWTRTSIFEYKSYSWIWLFAFIWLAAGSFYKQIFRRYLWRLCHYSQSLLNLICLASLIYMMWVYLEVDMVYIKRTLLSSISVQETIIKKALGFDFDFLAEAMVGPPVIHLLYSRCPQDVRPGRDSTLITMSNSLSYFFKSLVNYTLKSYVESVYQAPIAMALHNPFPVFYLWPFYFHNMYFNDLTVRIFYVTAFVVEFLIFVITYQLLVEVVVCEWTLARRWVATVLLSTIGLTMSVVCSTMAKMKAYIVTTTLTSMFEVVVICWCYPLDRLLDDVHFMNGEAMRPLRKWGLRLLPWYHIYKTYNMFLVFYDMSKASSTRRATTINVDYTLNGRSSWIWLLPVLPLFLGCVYAVVKIVLGKQNWCVLMKPTPEWGPEDHVTRQLRKQFDSRAFAGSQAPRFLARHILHNAHTPTYRLDVKYDDRQQNEDNKDR